MKPGEDLNQQRLDREEEHEKQKKIYNLWADKKLFNSVVPLVHRGNFQTAYPVKSTPKINPPVQPIQFQVDIEPQLAKPHIFPSEKPEVNLFQAEAKHDVVFPSQVVPDLEPFEPKEENEEEKPKAQVKNGILSWLRS